jgi:hypothetical protein
MRRRRWSVVGLILGVTACQLTEILIAPGERTLVVQSVIDRTQDTSFAVLEYSSIGDTAISNFGFSNSVPPGRPRFAVAGAIVTVEHLAGGCPGLVERLAEVPATGTLPTGRYRGRLTCLVPGERLGLRVTTPAGDVVTGETVIPGADGRSVLAGGSAARFVMDTLRFDRDRDTLRLSLDAPRARGMQVDIRRAEEHDRVSVIFVNDSLGVALPGTLINPFESDAGEASFRAGAYYLLTVAVADSNYFDFARTFSDPITGRGFLNHLKGGLGVFGSVETASYILRTVGTVDDPKEGTYRITGRVGDSTLDATLEAYLDPLYADLFSGFMKGTWVSGSLDVSGDGSWSLVKGNTRDPNAFAFGFTVMRTTTPRFRRYVMTGVRTEDGTPFSIELVGTDQGGNVRVHATLTGVQITGPGS